MAGYRTVFLDRDGTINIKAPEGQYVTDPDGLRMLPGAAEAIRRLNRSGRTVLVVSNQRGIARGIFDRARLDAVTARLDELLARAGAHVDGYYYCPHDLGECDCRKPAPGLLLAAAAERGLDLRDAVLVGDAESDVKAALAVGMAAIRLAGADATTAAPMRCLDLGAAVELIEAGSGDLEQPVHAAVREAEGTEGQL